MSEITCVQALRAAHEIVSDGAAVGFICTEGDWADRLFASQAKSSQALNSDTNAPAAVREALWRVRGLVSAAADVGFNCKDGDWADELFASQAKTRRALRAWDEAEQGVKT